MPKKSNHLIEQRDRFNQRLTLDIKNQVGEPINLNSYLKQLLATQSLEKWNGRQAEFQVWVAEQISNYIKNGKLEIWGHSN